MNKQRKMSYMRGETNNYSSHNSMMMRGNAANKYRSNTGMFGSSGPSQFNNSPRQMDPNVMGQYGVGQSNMKQQKGYQQLDQSQNSRRSELSLGNTEYSYNFNKTKNNLANMQNQQTSPP